LDVERQRASWLSGSGYAGRTPALAYDHALILGDALERVRAKLEYTTIATQLIEEPFSLSDLRHVYLAVWGDAPDLANFRRKVLSTPAFVVPAKRAVRAAGDAGGRPPTLYRRGAGQWVTPPIGRSAMTQDR
jgi:8-oxo-dGTP diphosphatase